MRCECYKTDCTQCTYQAQKGSKYCGVHKNCKRRGGKTDLPQRTNVKTDLKISTKVSPLKMDPYVMLKAIVEWREGAIIDLLICRKSEADYIIKFIKSHPNYEFTIWIGMMREDDHIDFKYNNVEFSMQPIHDLKLALFCVQKPYTHKVIGAILNEFEYYDKPTTADNKFEDFLNDLIFKERELS